MVKNSIKIYARLKQEIRPKSTKYDVQRTQQHETITFRLGGVGDFINNKPQSHKFRFQKVFEEDSNQTEVFSQIAKPVVDSVLEGFNGTIFAYGQTGSGKTYAITGSAEAYQERGLIPRSIEEIFGCISKAPDKFTIYISYLEIYKEIGYDLLNPRHKKSGLEESPKVVLLEDGKGESHLRNLSVQKVSSEQEAMKLLFLGDTNRTVAETPMNEYSSRSHCIFTIGLVAKNEQSGKIRKSKLNLVDLAGSERINKCNISGATLNEAKCINLSLHYLERVILALSQNRSHVPFRNSVLTYVLKDSLSGNCMTVLLATLAMNKNSTEETIATCKFAQRVAEVNTEALINAEIDPQQEIQYLKDELEVLRKELVQQSKFKKSGNLSETEKERTRNLITNYLNNDATSEFPSKALDFRHIQYGFKFLKLVVKDYENQKLQLVKSGENTSNAVIEQYEKIIAEKDEEIFTLKTLLQSNSKSSLDKTLSDPPDKENIPPTSDYYSMSPAQKTAFVKFLQNPKNRTEIDFYQESLQETYTIAKHLTSVVEQCQNNITAMRTKYHSSTNPLISAEIDLKLLNQQSIYRNSLTKLHELKIENQHLMQGMDKAKLNVLERFKKWYNGAGCVKNEIRAKTPTPRASSESNRTNPLANLKTRPSTGCAWNTSHNGNLNLGMFSKNICRGIENTYNNVKHTDKGRNTVKSSQRPSSRDFGTVRRPSNDSQSIIPIHHGYEKKTCSRKPSRAIELKLQYVSDQLDECKNQSICSSASGTDLDSSFEANSRPSSSKDLYDSFSDNVRHLVSERPYSSESSKRLLKANSQHYDVPLKNKRHSNKLTPRNDQNDVLGKPTNLEEKLILTERTENVQDQNLYSTSLKIKTWHNPIDHEEDFCLKDASINQNLNVVIEDHVNKSGRTSPAVDTENICQVEIVSHFDCFLPDDSQEFKNFVKTIPLTGDFDVDEEIVKFYRTKFINEGMHE